MEIDTEHISLRELLRAQDELTAVMTRRFQRSVALAFSDIVGSTQYFGRFGDAAGRALLQRHIDLIQRAIGATGRIVSTAGDGASLCFPSMDAAAAAASTLQRSIEEDNCARLPEQRLAVRVGLHFGRVLTDGDKDGTSANDVVLALADSRQTERISRWHFELHRGPDGLSLRSLSANPTNVDGKEIPNRGEVPILAGSVVKLSRVLTLTFSRDDRADRYLRTLAP